MAFGADYYVATYGSDSNSGRSLLSPFRTIQAAASVMVAGDVCHIREGTYRETLTPANSGSPGNPIVFKPYNQEKVVISGADLVTNWSVHEGQVYRAPMGWDLGEGFNQVFVNGTMMHQARWPNTGDDLLSPNLAAATATATNVTFTDSLSVSRPENHWVGGTVYGLFGGKWAAQGATITASSPTGALTVGDKTKTWYTGSGNAYITGIFAELDTEKEWFLQDGTLYLWAPGNQNPAGATVEAKARKWCVDLTAKSHIRVEDIDLFAGTVSMNGSSYCELSGSVLQYQSHFTKYSWGGLNSAGNVEQGDNGIYINGDNNVIWDCVIEQSAGSGIVIYGGNNLVSRCVIRYMDYSATYSCPLSIKGSTGGNQILFNTMHDAARDIIQLYGAKSDIIMYNHLYRAGRLCHDLGITYQWGRDGEGTVLAYNYIHDNLAPAPSNPGIYNDNYSRGFINHHNVIWNCAAGIRLNGPHDDMRVYNNTLFQCSDIGANTYNQYPDYMPAFWTYGNVLNRDIRNNLFLGSTPGTQLVDAAQMDFRLKTGAAAINAGVEIPSITDGSVGAPDLGAYESGINAPWTPGRYGGYSGTPVTDIQAASMVTTSSAVLNGVLTIPSDSDSEVWVVWGEKEGLMNVQSWDHAMSLGSFTNSGDLTHAIAGLKENTTYYYRFYAANSSGERWSETQSFLTQAGGGNPLTLSSGQDLDINSSGTRSTTGAQVVAGNAGVNAGADKRIFIQFDLSSIPADADIEAATLRLYHVEGASDNYGTATLYHVTSPWDAATVPYTHPVGPSLGTLVGNTGPFARYIEVDVTSIIQQYQTDPASHAGFSIRGTEGYTLTGKYFVSFEGTAGQRPELVITLAQTNEDTDNDGIPDAWEIETFGDLLTATSTSDFDEDGTLDVTEFKAGTDPQNAESRFLIDTFQIADGEISLNWPSATGRRYIVETAASIDGPWIPIFSNLSATPPKNTLSMPFSQDDKNAFFRILLQDD